ncbi:EndoU domain-containing protein [Deinococcus lacus]|uniref:EndoU domain-containing protein n=1 Tax=Deinococcus lacus TaxID=392561 RepID=A0ABW1YJ14_9DEIO
MSIFNPLTGKWNNKYLASTLFPKAWSEKEVRDYVTQAYATSTTRDGYNYVGKRDTVNGVTMKFKLDSNRSRVETGFPDIY